MSAFLVICILLLVLYFLVPTSIGLKDTKSPEQTNKIFQTVFEEQMNQSEEKEKEEEEERKPKIMEPAYRLEIAPSVSIKGPSGLGFKKDSLFSENQGAFDIPSGGLGSLGSAGGAPKNMLVGGHGAEKKTLVGGRIQDQSF